MPGNPLSELTKNLKESNFTYEPDSGWVLPSVTPSPNAVFDASSQISLAGAQSGHIKIIDNGPGSDIDNMINEVVPNGGGDRGWNITYGGKASATADNPGKEIDYRMLISAGRTWDYFRIWQPTNYSQRRYCYFEVSDIALISDWQVGDSVTGSTTGVGFIYEFNTTEGDLPRVYLDQFTGGNPANTFGAGKTITNDRTATSVSSQGSGIQGENAKHHIRWVDDTEFNPGIKRGYSNGAMSMEVDCAAYEGSDLSGDGFSSFKIATSAEAHPTVGERTNLIGDRFNFYDRDDNGSWVNFVIEFKRSSGEGINDAEFRLWKKTERAGGAYPNWTLVFENTGQYVYSPYQDNKFTDGYLFGNKNGAYLEDTTFYLNRWEYWTQKPQFLIDAGV